MWQRHGTLQTKRAEAYWCAWLPCHVAVPSVLRASIHWGLLVHNRWKAVTWITRSSWDNSSQTVLDFYNACQVVLNITCGVVVSSFSPQHMCTVGFCKTRHSRQLLLPPFSQADESCCCRRVGCKARHGLRTSFTNDPWLARLGIHPVHILTC